MDTTYNNGKDLMPSDVFVEQLEDGRYRAILGFQPYRALKNSVKFYMSTGATEKEAKRDLAETLKSDIDRAFGLTK